MRVSAGHCRKETGRLQADGDKIVDRQREGQCRLRVMTTCQKGF